MEQIFNIKRFINYTVYQLTAYRKSSLLIFAGSFVALFLFVFLMVFSREISNEEAWLSLFFGTSIVAALLLIGHSFPALRTDKTSLSFLTLPVSIFEKFVFEVLFKILLLIVIFPIIFWLIGNLSVGIADFIYPDENHFGCTFNELSRIIKEDFFPAIVWTYLFGVSLAFAGSTAFKKLPLVKTLVFVGLVIAAIVGYMYLIIEELHLDNGIKYVAESVFEKHENALLILYLFLAISTFLAMAYAYFNLKEREL